MNAEFIIIIDSPCDFNELKFNPFFYTKEQRVWTSLAAPYWINQQLSKILRGFERNVRKKEFWGFVFEGIKSQKSSNFSSILSVLKSLFKC